MSPDNHTRPATILKGEAAQTSQPALRELGRPARPLGATSTTCEPRLELIRLAGQVRGLEVHCTCGEKMTIELEFEGDKR